MLMQRHLKIKTIRRCPDVLGCVLDGFTCGGSAIPDVVEGNEALLISTLNRRGRSQSLAAIFAFVPFDLISQRKLGGERPRINSRNPKGTRHVQFKTTRPIPPESRPPEVMAAS